MKKIIAMLFAVVLSLCCISGCGKTVELPATTSEDADLYYSGSEFYNLAGESQDGYAFDKSGNIVNAEGEVVIAAANAVELTCVGSVEPVAELKATLDGRETAEGVKTTEPKEFAFKLNISPADCLNSTITIESSDPGALYFPYGKNANALADMETPETNELGSVTFKAGAESAELISVVRFEGDVELVVKNAIGVEVGRFAVKVNAEYKAADGDAETGTCEHEFVDTVVAATAKTQGYTLHTCKLCGESYRDNYTAKLNCKHEYTERVVPASYTSEGYTLHTCKLCGESYKDNTTAKLECKHKSTKDTVVEPTCVEGGYTLHECLICKNYSYKDKETPAKGHQFQDVETVAATCSAGGYTLQRCSVCGATQKINSTPATGAHNYVVTGTVTGDCTHPGYTQQKCSICGKEGPHINETPAPGHKMVDVSTSPATCTEAGHTQQQCSVCGYTANAVSTPALGHDWEEKQGRSVIREEMHTICAGCGLDLDAAGMSSSAAADHMYEHMDRGEPCNQYETMVPVEWEDYTYYQCRRCGAFADHP